MKIDFRGILGDNCSGCLFHSVSGSFSYFLLLRRQNGRQGVRLAGADNLGVLGRRTSATTTGVSTRFCKKIPRLLLIFDIAGSKMRVHRIEVSNEEGTACQIQFVYPKMYLVLLKKK